MPKDTPLKVSAATVDSKFDKFRSPPRHTYFLRSMIAGFACVMSRRGVARMGGLF